MSKLEKNKSVSFLRKKLWKTFSLYIRTRDAFKCFTCGKIAQGAGMHAAHFITGATCPTELYFDTRNVHAGCYHCNINLSGNWVIYEQRMIEKYGQKIVDELKKMRHIRNEKKDWIWYIEKQKEYEKLLQELQ